MGYRDFVMGDDPRRINLPASARRCTPTIVERVALREPQVLAVVDRSAAVGVRDHRACQVAAAALLATEFLSAIQFLSIASGRILYSFLIDDPSAVNSSVNRGLASEDPSFIGSRTLVP